MPTNGSSPLSVIIPALDEGDIIAATLTALSPLRTRGVEVIVVDGGSIDRTADLARPLADKVIASPRGRAVQMNAGAAIARADVFLFLHADTRLPPDADRLITEGLARTGRQWGRFDVRISGRSIFLPALAAFMNWRSRLTGIATGDQAIFVTRDLFRSLGGFPAIALMEDVALSARLKKASRPLCLRARVTTSGRRWERHGVVRTILLMWRLRLGFYFGAEPSALARRYDDARNKA